MTSTAAPPALAAAADRGEAAVRALVRAGGGAPIQDGATATFVWIGEADAVALRHWMDVFPPLPEFNRLDDAPVWWLTIDLPERSRISYKVAVVRDGRRSLLLDRLNPRRARDPFGSNSVVTGPGYQRPAWSLRSPAVSVGRVEPLEITSETFDEARRYGLYLPAGDPGGPLPLLVVHDGSDYAEYAALTVALDNLIASGDLPPLAAVLCDPTDRNAEYTGSERHARHLAIEVVPGVTAAVEIDEARVVAMGASLGAVAALHAARARPGLFSGLVLQSGSFVSRLGGLFRRGAVFAPVTEFMAEFREKPGPLPEQIYLSCGRYDGLLAENRTVAGFLRGLGVDVAYEEARDGHDWESWRDGLAAGLAHVFPPAEN